MIDFYTSIIITFSITLLTILTDWIAGKIIIYSRTISRLQRVLFSGMTAEDARKKARYELERLKALRAMSSIWGTDLATVAVSMDFAALGIWIYQPQMFPFFSKFNAENVSRDIQVWVVVLIIHLVLLLFSVVFKHHQQETIGRTHDQEMQDFLRAGWLGQNRWLLASNFIGFLTLLSSIVVFTNSL